MTSHWPVFKLTWIKLKVGSDFQNIQSYRPSSANSKKQSPNLSSPHLPLISEKITVSSSIKAKSSGNLKYKNLLKIKKCANYMLPHCPTNVFEDITCRIVPKTLLKFGCQLKSTNTNLSRNPQQRDQVAHRCKLSSRLSNNASQVAESNGSVLGRRLKTFIDYKTHCKLDYLTQQFS